jgi:hypothetical protein
MTVEPKFTSQVTEPGPYIWIDRDGVKHAGYVFYERQRLASAFVSESGHTRAVNMNITEDQDRDNGLFYGPLDVDA